MKTLFKVLLSLIIVVGVGFGVRMALQNSFLKVQKVNIVFKKSKKSDVLLSKLKKDMNPQIVKMIGQPLYDVDISDLMKSVESDKRVKEAQIRRRFPNQIDIIIQAKKPQLLLLSRKNQFYPVASDASLLPALGSGEWPNLPILRGKNFLKKLELRKRVIDLLSELPKEGTFNVQNISEIRFSKKDGFILYLTHSGAKVKIGNDKFAVKAKHVNQVIKYLSMDDLRGRVIDARFSKKVVVKLRNEP